MARQVDVKALISHIVKGDGDNKCRICMGDTSEGQVFLGDTVMMDGSRPVSFSELLETITGVEIAEQEGMPGSVCRECSADTIAAMHLRLLVNNAKRSWEQAIVSLENLKEPSDMAKTLYVFIDDNETMSFEDPIGSLMTASDAANRLASSLNPSRVYRKRIRKVCNCPDCGKKFKIPEDLNEHLMGTTNRVCHHCAEVVPREKLKEHLLNEHRIKLYDCKKCYKLFESNAKMKEHESAYHSGKVHQCNICGLGFLLNERALRSHMYIHTLFDCANCGRTFSNRKCYKHHKLSCKGERAEPELYICDHCGNTYNKKPSLSIHMVQKHINVLPYQCSDCGKRVSTSSQLACHKKTHLTHEQRLERAHTCYICGALLKTQLGFTLHLRIHSGEKPYECETCGARFLSISRRSDHVKRKHSKIEDFQHVCPMCPAMFLRPFELRRHLEGHKKGSSSSVGRKMKMKAVNRSKVDKDLRL